MSSCQDHEYTGMQMEDNGVDFPRPGRQPVRGERPLRAPGHPDADAMALHGLGLVPMDMSEDDASSEDDSDEDDLNHEEVRSCSSTGCFSPDAWPRNPLHTLLLYSGAVLVPERPVRTGAQWSCGAGSAGQCEAFEYVAPGSAVMLGIAGQSHQAQGEEGAGAGASAPISAHDCGQGRCRRPRQRK